MTAVSGPTQTGIPTEAIEAKAADRPHWRNGLSYAARIARQEDQR